MVRVKDPNVSLAFYRDVLGMTLLRTRKNPDAGFNLYFLGYPSQSAHLAPDNKDIPDGVATTVFMQGLVELTWNYGTETIEGAVYNLQMEDVRLNGFVQLAVGVGDFPAAYAELQGKGLVLDEDQKTMEGGSQERVTSVAVRDPDGYVIRIVPNDGWGCLPN